MKQSSRTAPSVVPDPVDTASNGTMMLVMSIPGLRVQTFYPTTGDGTHWVLLWAPSTSTLCIYTPHGTGILVYNPTTRPINLFADVWWFDGVHRQQQQQLTPSPIVSIGELQLSIRVTGESLSAFTDRLRDMVRGLIRCDNQTTPDDVDDWMWHIAHRITVTSVT
jgi:hypothetical protein